MTRSLAVLALCAGALFAAEKWTVDDILLAEQATAVRLSPDKSMMVWVKGQLDKEKGEPVANLVLRYLADGTEVTLTRGQDSHGSPRFSPDSKRIAFLSSRKPETGGAAPSAAGAPTGSQVWLLDVRGGEPYALTRFERGVRLFEWLDGNTLLLAAPEDPSLHDQAVKERKDTSQPVDDELHAPPVRLFRFDVATKKATRLTENGDRISKLFTSPDGLHAVTVHDRSLQYIFNQKVRPATFLHDLKKGTAVQLFADNKLLPQQVEWKPDSRGFYFTAPFTTHPTLINASIEKVHEYDLATGKATEIDLQWERGLGGSIRALPDGFLALLANGVRHQPARYVRGANGYARQPLTGDHAANLFAFEASHDGALVLYRHGTAARPAQWFKATLDSATLKDAQPVTSLNAGWKTKPLAKSETVTWKGALDEPVEGLLLYPHDWQAGEKRPLVVMIHGGPHGADMDDWRDSWAYPTQLFAQRGALILRPNYHGSSLYGLKWGESISNGKYNDLEWVDVEKGVDALIARGLVDPQKLGIMGWSNGSIITIEVTTRTTRYKAASAGAGDVNWTSDWGNAVFGDSFERYYLGKTPMEDPQLYIRKSPLWRMDKVTTPTAIFFGTEDKQVPTEQGWQHYRALQHFGKADVKFILFPGEAHGPRKYVHQKRKVDEELAWFDKHLFGTATDVNESLKPASPLAALLKLKAASETPEMVTRGRIAVSRFEVTRDQYRAFDPSYVVAPGTGRYPASGISFEQARQYCAWLSGKTGQKVRLGTEEEMASMLAANKGENTLDQWAGYAVNMDDAKRLASQIDGLGAGALLRPVGSFAGHGEDPVYDLGGNVAEWVTAKDGTGKALGGSADRPADAKSTGTPRVEYVGLRVVRDAE